MNYCLILLAQLIPIALLLYTYIGRKYSFWSKLGVNGPKPSLLSLGNVFQIIGQSPVKIEVENLLKYGKVYGNYAGLQPILTVCDHKLIKQILVKDFPLWTNRRYLKTYHEMNNNGQFFAEGAQWKRLRTITGKTFTSGKLKGMNALMDQCIDKLSNYLDKLITHGNGLLNTKEVVSGFTIDVIATTSFAIETNTNEEQNQQNPFVTNALNLFEISPIRMLSFFAMPRWFNALVKVRHNFNVQCYDFFLNLTGEVLKQRKSRQDSKRNDLVQLLMDTYAYDAELEDSNYDRLTADASNENSTNETKSNGISSAGKTKSKLTDREIMAQSNLFFIAGFETTASTISNIIYELSQNFDVQEKLYDEIQDAVGSLDSKSEEYFDTVMNRIPYMDAVIKETLRKYPPVVRLERRLVANEYKLAGIPMQKDQLIEISAVAVHYNPEYYPKPEQFSPSRFMPENKHLLVPYTYLPFGDGPRNCVGMRFAYQEIKLLLAKIVPKYRISSSPKTPSSPQFGSFKAILFVKPFEVKVEKRVH